jgi:hypothetical protein
LSDNVVDLDKFKQAAWEELSQSFREAVMESTGGKTDYYPANQNEDPYNPFGGLESYMMFAPGLSVALGQSPFVDDEDLLFVDEEGNEYSFCEMQEMVLTKPDNDAD